MTPATHSDPRRVRRVSDGVVAAYIHDISARTTPSSPSRRDESPAARLPRTRAALRARRDAHAFALGDTGR